MKDESEVIKEFGQLVNMSSAEIKKFLDTDESKQAGWPKGDSSGDTIGRDSGHKISDILDRNPEKAADKYEEDDISHMRKVVSYIKRHKAQEDKLKDSKTEEELEHTKSTISLKNWGHDPLKTLDSSSAAKKQTDKQSENGSKADGKTESPKKDDGDKKSSGGSHSQDEDQESKDEKSSKGSSPQKQKASEKEQDQEPEQATDFNRRRGPPRAASAKKAKTEETQKAATKQRSPAKKSNSDAQKESDAKSESQDEESSSKQ